MRRRHVPAPIVCCHAQLMSCCSSGFLSGLRIRHGDRSWRQQERKMGARKGKDGTHDDLGARSRIESPKWDATNVEQTTDAATPTQEPGIFVIHGGRSGFDIRIRIRDGACIRRARATSINSNYFPRTACPDRIRLPSSLTSSSLSPQLAGSLKRQATSFNFINDALSSSCAL